jgi:hypothetical protein
MRRELKNIAEDNKPSNDAFASVVRSFGDANSRFQALAVESVGRAVEIQSEFVGKAYDTYISEISKLGRMFFVGYRTFTARRQDLPHANLNKKTTVRPQAPLAEVKVKPDPARRRTAAHSMTTKRRAGTVAKSQSGKRSTKANRKVRSARRGRS